MTQAAALQSNEGLALSPPKLQSRITDLLASSPEIAEAVSANFHSLCLCVCIYVYMCMCVCICIVYVYVHVHVYVCTVCVIAIVYIVVSI